MTVVRLRDQLRNWVPWWLQDRRLSSGKTAGFRFLWVMVATLDCIIEWTLQSLQAPWPGRGTPTALPYIGRSRGIIRSLVDTDATFGDRLRSWLDKWKKAGSQLQLATEIHEYLGPYLVRVITRGGNWISVAANGTVTTNTATWNWDSVSNPERAGYWSDLFIVVYPTPWAVRGGVVGDLVGEDTFGLGQLVPREQLDAVKGIINQWKSAHSRVRAVIWTSDVALFDPLTPASCPDGTWGEWWQIIGGVTVASNRNTTTCRYWEPWQ